MAQMDPPDYHKMWLSAEDRLMVGGTKMIALQDELDIMRADLHLARDQRDAAVARAERAEADRGAHAAEARALLVRVIERLVQGATAHRERAERAEALLREALAEVEGEPGDTHEALSFALLDRIRAHLSARSPKPGGA